MQMQQSLFPGSVAGFFGRAITAPSLLIRTTCPPSKPMEFDPELDSRDASSGMQRMHLTHDAMQMPAGRANMLVGFCWLCSK
jgi:hypothetical protein